MHLAYKECAALAVPLVIRRGEEAAHNTKFAMWLTEWTAAKNTPKMPMP